MIIKQVLIENFLCYYGTKKFNLSKGLNIILGENGEGKTKFFESIEWLCSSEKENLEDLVSKKALNEIDINKSLKVRVQITVEHLEEKKILSKEFTFKKTGANKCDVNNLLLSGVEESNNGERNKVDGKGLLENIFPSGIRKYSMFKGEEDLNIFDNSDALIDLIKLFSDAKYYDKYELKGESLKIQSEKALAWDTKLKTKNKSKYDEIEKEIKLKKDINIRNNVFLDQINVNIEKVSTQKANAEKHVSNAEELEIINTKIKKINKEIENSEVYIKENYTESLFDEQWILMNFENFHKEFSDKVAMFSKSRRKAQSQFDIETGIKEGERRAKTSLYKDLIPLPIGTPSKAVMDEMIKEKFCKVCNREAEEGSDALKFMKDRLQDFLNSQKNNKTDEETEKLFKYDFVTSLETISRNQENKLSDLRKINSKISDQFEFNQDRKNEKRKWNDKLESLMDDRTRIIGNSSQGADSLSNVLINYNQWVDELKRYELEKVDYKKKILHIKNELIDLEKQKEEFDLTNANKSLIDTRNMLRDLATIFKDTKERKFNDFIDLLSAKSNDFLTKINVDAFIGKIDFDIINFGSNTKVKIQLLDENSNLFRPNKSLETSMHISVLLAISELTKEVISEKYPIMFDAATSSFGETKMTQFLNLIYETDNQTIILMKDYLAKNDKSKLIIKPEFSKVRRHKAFWVKLERPFDKLDLKTINSEPIEI